MANAAYSSGSKIVLFDCGSYANENFQTIATSNGFVWIVPTANPSLALNVAGNSMADGAGIVLFARGNYVNEYIALL